MNRTGIMQVLEVVETLLDHLDAELAPAGERLECVRRTQAVASRFSALAGLNAARAERAQESLRDQGTPTTTWLATKGGLSKREAAGLLHRGQELAERPAVGDATVSGTISVAQARAISSVLRGMEELPVPQQDSAEALLLELATTMDSDQLKRSAPQVLRQVDPAHAAETLERRLQRQAEAAHRNRSLVFGRDHNGSVTFSGSLPLVEGEAWITVVDAYAQARRRSIVEERDPLAEALSPAQRRADALVAMIREHQTGRRAPATGGDRARVTVTLSYDRLRERAAGAGLIADGEPLSAGDLRRLCCDAALLPAVLGGPSEVLDVGRSHRLVTPPIRAALTLRDGGCVFPGCETRAAACEAHHLTPWWDGGETALSNLALLCHHHHGLVEPAKYSTRDQWELRIAADGVPEAIPPLRYDHQRRPMRHRRFSSDADPPIGRLATSGFPPPGEERGRVPA